MKAIFCYDGPLYKDEQGNYFDSILNDQMFERYFKVADKLKLVIRTKDIDSKNGTKKMNRLSNPNISVVECPNLSSISGLISNRKKAKEIIEKEIREADLIFIRLPSVIGNISVDIAKKFKKKYLIEVVGCPWDAYWNYSLKGKMVAPFATQMMKTRIKKAPYVLYVTNMFLQRRYPTNGETVNCSNVELQNVNEEILKNRIAKIDTYGDEQKLVIGTAAGLDVVYKGQQYVIEAIAKLKNKGIDCFEYQVIGGGTGNNLKKLATGYGIKENFEVVGQLPHEQVFDWLDSIDIYAQPSRQEGLPRAMIEAMSRGLPCIGARTAGIPELIESSCVFSNSKTEVDEICELLMAFKNNRERMKKLSTDNFNEAKKYQRSILVNRRTEFFKEFAKN